MQALETKLAEQLGKLRLVLVQLPPAAYSQSSLYLGNASIGAHTRHILELLLCLTKGYQLGLVDYYNRTRDLSIEVNLVTALQQLDRLLVLSPNADKSLEVFDEEGIVIQSTYFRELVYQIEHAIHHMALISVALREFGIPLADPTFGFAYSTIAYQEQCAQ